ncbi:MAG: hypothetical protein GXO92_01565 [FCB group bacterium]|nr:hypothetical protein [FCB group bacterium]
MIRGYGHSGLESSGDDLSFVGGSFNPIFLFQQSERLIFESELELSIDNEGTEVDLEYANISYVLNKRVILRLGKFLLPFGSFMERLHPAWINRLSSVPLGLGHHDPVGPTADFGIEVRGAIPLGAARLSYSTYIVNGPALNDGSSDPNAAGMLRYNNIEDNNRNKALGGRIAILPFSNASLEIGLSGQVAGVGDEDSDYKDVFARFFAVDMAYIRSLPALSSVIDVRAQFNSLSVDKAYYAVLSEQFTNESNAYYAQLSLRPAYVTNRLLKQLEFVGRYSNLAMAEGAPWESTKDQVAVGVNYWLDWRSVLKFSYQRSNAEEAGESGTEDHDSGTTEAFFIHWAIGF